MDTTHPIRVVLFWDSKHARDAYGPYFTRAAKRTWTFTLMVTHDELVRKILKHQEMDPSFWRVRIIMRVPDISKEGIHVLVEFELIQLQIFSEVQHTHVSTDEDHPNSHQHVTAITHMENDEDDDDVDEDCDVSSESDNDNNPNDKEDDISTLLNALSSTIVNQ
ncbi:hypothetical protein M9H77_35576 [Catharanthus roseus]|uniref:Uncharacterized protein n=1 Tax=Catharanthus roseus TaxID=4058 RepID=A0ACB9ZRY5_CATRO|nr:hypothetical protein M9H77_35576 [Catharanthus roseus]